MVNLMHEFFDTNIMGCILQGKLKREESEEAPSTSELKQAPEQL